MSVDHHNAPADDHPESGRGTPADAGGTSGARRRVRRILTVLATALTHMVITTLVTLGVLVLLIAYLLTSALARPPGTVPKCPTPPGVNLRVEGRQADAAGTGGNAVSVIDTATNAVIAAIPVGTGPLGVAVSPDGRHVYVTNTGTQAASRLMTRVITLSMATAR